MRKISKENQRFTRSIPRKLLSFSIALGLLTPFPNIENPTTGEVSTSPSGDSTLTSDAILTSEPDEVEPATQTTAPGTVQDNVILEPKNRREDLGTLQ